MISYYDLKSILRFKCLTGEFFNGIDDGIHYLFPGTCCFSKDSTKAASDLSFHGRSCADKVGLKVFFRHLF